MNVCWITATHDPDILGRCLLPCLEPLGELFTVLVSASARARGWWTAEGDALVVVTGAASIAQAYNVGAQAAPPGMLRVWVHHDVVIPDTTRLGFHLGQAAARPDVGMVGVIGSRDMVVPWWEGPRIGAVKDTRIGGIGNPWDAAGPAAVLDGLLLASARDDIVWDESIPGWHLYDHDQCRIQLAAGRTNWCIAPEGGQLVEHHNGNPTSLDRVAGWAPALAAYEQKWGDT